MADYLTSEQSTRIDNFVRELTGETKGIVTGYLGVPNTPDCQAEIMALCLRFDFGLIDEVSSQIEGLRRELGLQYTPLQKELQKRL